MGLSNFRHNVSDDGYVNVDVINSNLHKTNNYSDLTNRRISIGGDIMCCEPIDRPEDTVGECPDCGAPIDEDGDPTEGCSYSPTVCDTCGYRPCDDSC